MDEVINTVKTSNITEDNKLVKCRALAITQLLGIQETKKQEERRIRRKKKN